MMNLYKVKMESCMGIAKSNYKRLKRRLNRMNRWERLLIFILRRFNLVSILKSISKLYDLSQKYFYIYLYIIMYILLYIK